MSYHHQTGLRTQVFYKAFPLHYVLFLHFQGVKIGKILCTFYDNCYVNQWIFQKQHWNITSCLAYTCILRGAMMALDIDTDPGKENRPGYCSYLNFCFAPVVCFTIVLFNISINAAEYTLFRTLFTPKGLSLHRDILILYF